MTSMPDQASALRRLARDSAPLRETTPATPSSSHPGQSPRTSHAHTETIRRAPAGSRASVISVTSGKGGVGKSNVAVNLACRFASAGKRVLLIDADLGLANADVLCNVEVPFNLSHVISGRKSVRDIIVRTPAGFDLVGGASGLSRMADLDEAGRRVIFQALTELERSADVVLVDTGAGISTNVLSFCRAADHVLVVTTPEPTAVTDAYAMIKSITSPSSQSAKVASTPTLSDRRISLLVNQVASVTEARAVYERVARVARQFLSMNVLDAGHVIMDEEMTRAVRRRTPLILHAPNSPASRCLAQLALRLEPDMVPDNTRGFFGKLFRRSKGKGN